MRAHESEPRKIERENKSFEDYEFESCIDDRGEEVYLNISIYDEDTSAFIEGMLAKSEEKEMKAFDIKPGEFYINKVEVDKELGGQNLSMKLTKKLIDTLINDKQIEDSDREEGALSEADTLVGWVQHGAVLKNRKELFDDNLEYFKTVVGLDEDTQADLNSEGLIKVDEDEVKEKEANYVIKADLDDLRDDWKAA